jgi:hypothetical protein
LKVIDEQIVLEILPPLRQAATDKISKQIIEEKHVSISLTEVTTTNVDPRTTVPFM